MDHDTLYQLLQEWFQTTKFAGRNVWNQNRVAKLIRDNLKALGHFKNKSGGKRSLYKKRQISTEPQVPAPAPNKDDW